jgi:hypothetical protein
MKKLYIILIVLIGSTILHSQFENHRWYFTNTDYGIHFDTATNVPAITHEHISPYANEGSCIADNPLTGELIFYSTGDKAVDLSHQVMPNGSGLTSNASTANKGIICPKPGNCNQYYIFQNTSARETAPGSYYYSVVDMSLIGNGASLTPLGDVVSGQKNIFLKNNTGEASIVVRSTMTNKYWLIISTFDANELYVYKIDSTGINLNGTFNVPFTITDFRNCAYNYKFDKLSSVSGVESEPSLLFDFNRTTGILSNCVTVPGTPVGPSTTYFEGMFDTGWSEDGTKLYITKYRTPTTSSGGQIYQYDLNTPLTNAQSIYNEGGTTSNPISELKKGPNGKIYFVHVHPVQNFKYLGVINNPNIAGVSSNAVALGFDLGVNPAAYSGLSDHMTVNSKPIAYNDTVAAICGNSNIDSINILNNDVDPDDHVFSISFFNIPAGVTISENADQTINIDLQNITLPSVSIPYSICDGGCFSKCDTAYMIINISPSPPLDFLIPDTFVCNDNAITLSSLLLADSYLWEIGDTTAGISINNPGVYNLEIMIGGCPYYDSTVVSEEYTPFVNLGPDTIICNAEFIILDASFPASNYLWNNGSITSQIPVNSNGSYFVEVTNLCGSYFDTINVTFSSTPIVDLGPDTSICPGQTLTLSAFWPGATILWSTSETTPFIDVTTGGVYSVTVTNSCGSDIDNITVTVKSCLGVENINTEVMIYPNPANDYIYIGTPNQHTHLTNASLISIDGRSILLTNMSQSSQMYYFDLSEISSGIYLISLDFEEGKTYEKIIINR